VTDGNSEEVAHGGSEEEAAWLDLVGRFDAPVTTGDAPVPWPESENLPAPPAPAPGGIASGAGPTAPPPAARPTGPRPGAEPGDPPPGVWPTGPPPGAGRAGPLPWAGSGAGAGPTGPAPGAGPTGPATGAESAPGAGPTSGAGSASRGVVPAPPDPPAEEDEHYVPPPPPPLPRLSPVTKGAWVALFGGPGYLFAATMAGWTIPGWLGFGAVAAFIAGFIVLVLHVGDDRDRDSDPDDGAVV
jgi:hypothetical protein